MAAPEVNKIFTAIVLDFETGGLDPKKHGITQLGMQAIRLDTFEIIDSYKNYVIPYHKVEVGKKKAVVRKKKSEENDEPPLMEYDWNMTKKYTGITEEMCYDKGIPLEQLVADIVSFAEKSMLTKGRDTVPIVIGQNIRFDVGFIYQIFEFTKTKLKGVFAGVDGFYGWDLKTLDTTDLARLIWANNKSVTSYKLGDIAERLDIDLFDAHDAMGDVEATADIVRVSANRLRATGGTVDGGDVEEKKKTRNHWSF